MPQETLYTQILDLDALDVYLETEVNDDLGYYTCNECKNYDGIITVSKKEWYGEEE